MNVPDKTKARNDQDRTDFNGESYKQDKVKGMRTMSLRWSGPKAFSFLLSCSDRLHRGLVMPRISPIVRTNLKEQFNFAFLLILRGMWGFRDERSINLPSPTHFTSVY